MALGTQYEEVKTVCRVEVVPDNTLFSRQKPTCNYIR